MTTAIAAPVNTHSRTVEECRASMRDLVLQIAEYASETEDRLLTVSGATFLGHENSAGHYLAIQPDRYSAETFALTEHSTRQLCGYLDLQPSFISRCLSLGMGDLAATTIQRFFARALKERGEAWTLFFRLRHTGGDQTLVRSISTERYGVFDNALALDLLTDELPREWGQPVPLKQYGDADNLRGTLLFPETVSAVVDDSDYYLGLYYRNSEVGSGAFGISPFLFRSYCTNTAIYGKRDAGAPDIKTIHLGAIDRDGVRARLAGGLELARKSGPNLLKLMGYADAVTITEPEPIIAHVSELQGWGPAGAKAWLNGFLAEPQPSGRGIVNGLTRAAQEFSGDRRIEMETQAGELLAPHILADLEDVADHWHSQVAGADAFTKRRPKRFAKYFSAEVCGN
jgi:hypothetical protein